MANQKERLEFLQSFERLLGNWKLEESRVKNLAREYEAIWDKVGSYRFNQGVTNVIQNSQYQFFPSVGEFMGFVPDRKRSWLEENEAVTREMRFDREVNPDSYFGEADVIAMMRVAEERAAKGLKPLTGDQMIAEVLNIRHACQEKRG